MSCLPCPKDPPNADGSYDFTTACYGHGDCIDGEYCRCATPNPNPTLTRALTLTPTLTRALSRALTLALTLTLTRTLTLTLALTPTRCDPEWSLEEDCSKLSCPISLVDGANPNPYPYP